MGAKESDPRGGSQHGSASDHAGTDSVADAIPQTDDPSSFSSGSSGKSRRMPGQDDARAARQHRDKM